MNRKRNGNRWNAVTAVLAGMLLWAAPVPAADLSELGSRIEKLVSDPALSSMRIGVRVDLIHPRRVLVYERLADEPLKPASNQKLITTAAAMDVLPGDFTYRTLLAQRGNDLIVIGDGDPSIGDPRMAREAGESITAPFHRWADVLEELGVRRVPGDLVFDDFIFEQEHIHPRWREDFNLQSWYAAPVGGLNFNDNCVDVVITPGPEPGKPAVVELVPNTPWVRLKNTTRTASQGEPIIARDGSGPITISVSGPVSSPNSRESPFSVAVIDPGAFFASTFRTVLAARGIQVDGGNRREQIRHPGRPLPDNVRVIAVYERPMHDTLWRINRSSQNLFAEALLKTLGAYAADERANAPGLGSYESGRRVIERFLASKGIPIEGCVIDDGSGLSHGNLATAGLFVAVLAGMDTHPLREVWWDSLAVPGDSRGTLRRRMRDLDEAVRAKTGHIRGVSTLSGYVIGPGGQRYAFSVLCNDTNRAAGGSGAAQRLQEAICRELATWNPASGDRSGG